MDCPDSANDCQRWDRPKWTLVEWSTIRGGNSSYVVGFSVLEESQFEPQHLVGCLTVGIYGDLQTEELQASFKRCHCVNTCQVRLNDQYLVLREWNTILWSSSNLFVNSWPFILPCVFTFSLSLALPNLPKSFPLIYYNPRLRPRIQAVASVINWEQDGFLMEINLQVAKIEQGPDDYHKCLFPQCGCLIIYALFHLSYPHLVLSPLSVKEDSLLIYSSVCLPVYIWQCGSISGDSEWVYPRGTRP